MGSPVVFACSRGGLAGMLRGGLLGGYDGAGAWTLTLQNIRSGDEQMMVETHEGLHHELQASTGWGLLSAMALMLSQRGYRRNTLGELFDAMVGPSRETHERFATVVSAAVAGVDQVRGLLEGNGEYLGHLDGGLGLAAAGEAVPWQLRETAVAAVLRCCMAPAVVLPLLADVGFEQLSWTRLDLGREAPDSRLAAFAGAGGPGSWGPVFDAVTAEHPDRGGDRGDARLRDLPEDPDRFQRLRVFEEEVLLRRCYEHAATVLESAGFQSVPWTAQEQVARTLKTAVERVDGELAERLNVVTRRRPVLDDGLEYDRQKIRLRERSKVELLGPDETPRLRGAFECVDGDGDRFVAGVWLRRGVAAKQFALPDDFGPSDPLVALIAAARDRDGSPVVRLGLLPPDTTPRACQRMLGEVPLVVLTSHLTLTDPGVERTLRRVEPVFVVMDLPVAWHVDDWVRQGARVSFALAPLETEASGELWLAVFAVDLAPGMRFLSIGGKVGVSLLVERLRRRHEDKLEIAGGLLREHATALNLAVGTVLASWHVLDQDALT